MAKKGVTKTGLVWAGKYDEDGALEEAPRVGQPFQAIETVNESRATREARKGGVRASLLAVYEGDEGHRQGQGLYPITCQAPFTRLGGPIRRSDGCTVPAP